MSALISLLPVATYCDYDDDVTCSVVCPRGVGNAGGSDVMNMASSNTMTHLLLNATFPCRAYVRSWTYFRSRDSPRVFASVWRKEPATDNYFRLVGVNVLPSGDVGWHQVVIMRKADRIAVHSGDFIGFHYSGADVYRYNSSFNIIAIRNNSGISVIWHVLSGWRNF